MNKIFDILSSILGKFNNFVDNLDKRYLDIIKQISIILIGSLWAFGLVYGYLNGRGAAKITGITIIESTDDIFDIDINLQRKDNFFKDVLKEELESEMSKPDYSKVTMYEAPDLRTELKTEIFETDFDKKENPGFSPINKDGIAEAPIIDKTARETDEKGIIEKEEIVKPNTPLKKNDSDIQTQNDDADIDPMNKNDGIVE